MLSLSLETAVYSCIRLANWPMDEQIPPWLSPMVLEKHCDYRYVLLSPGYERVAEFKLGHSCLCGKRCTH